VCQIKLITLSFWVHVKLFDRIVGGAENAGVENAGRSGFRRRNGTCWMTYASRRTWQDMTTGHTALVDFSCWLLFRKNVSTFLLGRFNSVQLHLCIIDFVNITYRCHLKLLPRFPPLHFRPCHVVHSRVFSRPVTYIYSRSRILLENSSFSSPDPCLTSPSGGTSCGKQNL